MSSILVLLGTDHHPFDRLVSWADKWASAHPSDRVVIQHGHTAAPRHAEGVAFLSPQELRRQVLEADLVITHGGPGTMTDALTSGRRPLLVPRDPARGEHVDDHQMRFGPWAADKGLVILVAETQNLDCAVEAELRSPTSWMSGGGDRGAAASARLSALLADRAPVGPVLYIVGAGRSGSTILERVLGQDPRVVPLGEVVHLWTRGLEKNELCGCATPLHDCAFWSAVGHEAFGGWGGVDLARLRQLAEKVDRQRWIPITAAPVLTPAMRALTDAYTSHYRAVYAAALKVGGGTVVIDSSKHPSLALALSHDAGVDLRVLHLVRDSLGVTHSWSKSVLRPEAVSAVDAQMKRYSPRLSAAMWLTANLEAELLRGRGVTITRVRYEDFVRQPQQHIEHIWTELRLPGAPPQLVAADGSVSLRPNHTAAGNPSRFAAGHTQLRADHGWMDGLAPRDRRTVALLTGGLRAAYGYGRRPRSGRLL